MRVREVPAGEGNIVVQVCPLDDSLHRAAWEIYDYLSDVEEPAHVVAKIENLRTSLAKAGVTRESVESWEES